MSKELGFNASKNTLTLALIDDLKDLLHEVNLEIERLETQLGPIAAEVRTAFDIAKDEKELELLRHSRKYLLFILAAFNLELR